MRNKSLTIFVLFIVPLMMYVVPLPFTPLMEPDEGRYSAISSAMNATGDYITPRLKDTVYFEKPPFCYWATALFFRIFGENEFSSRLLAALSAWGCIILVYRIGVYFHGVKTGLYAAAVLTTFLYHAAIGRLNILDMPLALFVSIAVWAGYRYLASAPMKRVWLYLLYFFSAIAFLTKGLIGMAFPFGVLVSWLVISGQWRKILALVSPVGIMINAAVSLPWLILVQRSNPDFFRFFFIQEHLLRYVTKFHGHYEPFYFYVPIVIAGTLPWCAYLPQAFRNPRNEESPFSSREKRFLSLWFGFIFVFFSASSSKLVPYIAPVFLPIALYFGHIFRTCEERIDSANFPAHMPAFYRIPGILQAILFIAILPAPAFFLKYRVGWHDWWPLIVIPFVAQILMVFVPDRLRSRNGRGWFGAIYILFSIFFISLTPPLERYLSPYKSAYPVSQAIRQYVPKDETLYQYGICLYGIDFYTGRRTPIVDDIGELRYGSEQLPRSERENYFLTSDAFFRLVAGKDGIYCATKNDKRFERLKKEVPTLRLLWHNNAYALVYLTKIKDKEP